MRGEIDLKGPTQLPFAFRRLPWGDYIIVSQGGEFLFLTREELLNLASKGPEKTSDIYPKLKGKHFLADLDLELQIELISTQLRTRKAFLTSFTALHMIVVTARCDCCCDYCHASSAETSRTELDMNPATARAVIDMVFKSPSPVIKIEFQGGEPTLNWKVIEECVKRGVSKNKKAKRNLEFVLCTNLNAKMDKHQLDFCKRYGIMISTSLDGPRDLHDFHRRRRDKGSAYDNFRENLGHVRNVLGPDCCSALLTVTKDHLSRLEEVVDHYVDIGFNGIFLRALNPYGYAIRNYDALGYPVDEFVEAYKAALMHIIRINLEGRLFVEYYTALLLRRILTPFSTGFVDMQSPSGAGISGVIYDYNGEIYPADEARMLARMGDKRFLMGNVSANSWEEIFGGSIIREIVNNSCVEALPNCATCAYQLYCGADPIRNYAEGGALVAGLDGSSFCRKNQAIIDSLFEIIKKNDEKTMNVFWSWITGRNLEDVALGNIQWCGTQH